MKPGMGRLSDEERSKKPELCLLEFGRMRKDLTETNDAEVLCQSRCGEDGTFCGRTQN